MARTRYKIYKVDGDKLWLVDDFYAKDAAVYVHKTIPNFLNHVKAFGYCEGDGYKAVPYDVEKVK